jgi:hypothetical protein
MSFVATVGRNRGTWILRDNEPLGSMEEREFLD